MGVHTGFKLEGEDSHRTTLPVLPTISHRRTICPRHRICHPHDVQRPKQALPALPPYDPEPDPEKVAVEAGFVDNEFENIRYQDNDHDVFP